MNNNFFSLGLMSGTSMDGIDLSIIHSNGENEYEAVFDKYFEYDKGLYQDLTNLRAKINSSKDLKFQVEIVKSLEKKITLFHAKVTNEVLKESNINIDFIGFHGQTIFHNAEEKLSKQLGDGKLLSSLTKKTVVYDFRQNDLIKEGQGAPLTPIFHQLIVNKNKIDLPVCILNIGGVANLTIITSHEVNNLKSYDIGPGNCLIDDWIRKKIKKKYDENGKFAKLGKTNKIILNQALDNFNYKKNKSNLSFDVKDFDLSFVRGFSLEDGASVLTDFTVKIITSSLISLLSIEKNKVWKVLICGGGRKNSYLMKSIKKINSKNFVIQTIDSYGINGDFVESQAFAFLAIRSHLNLPISFPNTTGCNEPCTGGVIVKNY